MSHGETEAVVKRCSAKKVLLKISQISQEITCARVSFFIKLQASGLHFYQKKESGTGLFLWILQNFQNNFFHRTPPVAASEETKLHLSTY